MSATAFYSVRQNASFTSSAADVRPAGSSAGEISSRLDEFIRAAQRNDSTSNWLRASLWDVYETLFRMTRLPEDHALHLSPDVASKSADVLSRFVHSFAEAPPRLINEDSEAVSFTWQKGLIKRYLSVDDESVQMIERDCNGRRVLQMDLGTPEELHLEELLNELASQRNDTKKDDII